MAKTSQEFQALMERVLSGSEEAAEELFREYEPYLLHAIRRHLSKSIRSKFDSLDFAQDVWASFYTRFPGKVSFHSAEELFSYLTTLARNMVIDAYRRRNAQRRDGGREQSLDDSTRFDKHGLHGNQQTPSQILMTDEEWTVFLRKQPPVYRCVFLLLREGKTHEEIAGKLNISIKTVARIIDSRLPGGMS